MIHRTLVVVISLKSATERRALFRAAASDDIKWEFFDALKAPVDGLRYDPIGAQIAHGRELFEGEIGVYSSHFALWKRLLEDELHDRYIIFEDDTIIDWDFLSQLSAAELPSINFLKLFFLRNCLFRLVVPHFTHRHRNILQIYGYSYGMQAYLITKQGARDFVRLFARMVRPVDDAVDRTWSTGLKNYAVFPFPAMERFGASSIGQARYAPRKVPGTLRLRHWISVARNKIAFHFTRLLFILGFD